MERVFPRYLHGAGLWRLRTGKEQDGAITPLAQAARSAVRPILGFTSEGLDQTEVCAALDIPIPQELLRGQQLRAWTELAREADAFTWLALCEDGVWMQQAYDASEPILRGTGLTLPRPEDAEACKTFAVRHKPTLRSATRAYFRRQVAARAEQGRQVRGSRDLWQRAPAVKNISLVDDFACETCNATFKDARRLAVHRAKQHKCWSSARQAAFGTRCEICTVEFWTHTRLQEHLRRSAPCLAAYAASDLTTAEEADRVRGRADYAWRPATSCWTPALVGDTTPGALVAM